MFGLSVEYNTYDTYCRRIGILCCTIPTIVLLEHVLEFLLWYELPLEFPAELALAIPPELAHAIPPELVPLLVLAHLLALPDLKRAL